LVLANALNVGCLLSSFFSSARLVVKNGFEVNAFVNDCLFSSGFAGAAKGFEAGTLPKALLPEGFENAEFLKASFVDAKGFEKALVVDSKGLETALSVAGIFGKALLVATDLKG
jgi:hypothetical protein